MRRMIAVECDVILIWCCLVADLLLSSWLIAATNIFDRISLQFFLFSSLEIVFFFLCSIWFERPQSPSSFAALFDWHLLHAKTTNESHWTYTTQQQNHRHRHSHRQSGAFQNQFNAFYHFIHRKRKSVYEWEGDEDLWLLFFSTNKPDVNTHIEWDNSYKRKTTNWMILLTMALGWKQRNVFHSFRLNRTIFMFQLAIYRLCARDDGAMWFCEIFKPPHSTLIDSNSVANFHFHSETFSLRKIHYHFFLNAYNSGVFLFQPLLDTHLYKWHGGFTYACVSVCIQLPIYTFCWKVHFDFIIQRFFSSPLCSIWVEVLHF